jgi:hypothetical protein
LKNNDEVSKNSAEDTDHSGPVDGEETQGRELSFLADHLNSLTKRKYFEE